MKFTLCAIGTRGDVVPLVALGRELVAHGSDVLVAAPPEFAADVAEAGLEFRPIAPMVMQLMEQSSSAMGSPARMNMIAARWLDMDLHDDLEELFTIAQGSDALIATGLSYWPPHVAEVLGIEYRHLAFFPRMYPSSSHPASSDPAGHRPKLVNTLEWWVTERFYDRHLDRVINPWRRDHGLPPATAFYRRMVGLPGERLLAADEGLAPLPTDVERVTRVSPIRQLETGSLPQSVEDFLAAGDPPAFFGFGSMSSSDAGRLLEIALQTAAALGVRMIVPAAWATAAARRVPQDCLAIDRVSHGLLFPHVAAVVHHGGAGTTTAAARAGVVQVVIPHAFDQFYWANRVFELGIGPKPLSYKRLSSRTLTSALSQALGSAAIAEGAETLARELDGRDGAVELATILHNRPSGAGAS